MKRGGNEELIQLYMRGSVVLFAMVFISLLSGCKTKRVISTVSDSKSEQSFEDALSQLDKLNHSYDLNIELEYLIYDTDKTVDELGNYPIKEVVRIRDKSKSVVQEYSEIKSDLKSEIVDNEIINNIDEKNISSKTEQKTSYIWAIVALIGILLVLVFVFKKWIKKIF